MAKTSSIAKNRQRRRLAKKYLNKRTSLKAIARDRSRTMEERFQAQIKLAELPRNSAPSRVRNRCEITGRPRGYYRKLRMSRIALRELSAKGLVPGMIKASW